MAGFLQEQFLRVCGRVFRSIEALRQKVQEREKKKYCTVLQGAVLHPQSRIGNGRGKESIQIGEYSRILGRLETRAHGGEIVIGGHCFIGEETYIWSSASIRIGNRVLISHGVNIHDNNSHSLSAKLRHQHFIDIFTSGHPGVLPDVSDAPIVIEDDVWIGFGATILKGVRIGRGAVVGACTLVTKDVPPFAVVVGSPARLVGQSFE